MTLDPRANQKARTRAAIVEAASQMLTSGQRPTVAQAAEQALVSRATAYRYFPTQDSLLLEVAAITPAAEPIERSLAEMTEQAPAERLTHTIMLASEMFAANEPSMRLALRTYLDVWLDSVEQGRPFPDGDFREGRRTRWIDLAIGAFLDELHPDQAERLRCALALTTGIEAHIVMRDVCHLPAERIGPVLEWAALALLAQAQRDAGQSFE